MWPMKNVIMRMGKGRDKNIITPGTIIWECALACLHLFLTVWPLPLWANSVFWSILLKALLLSAKLTQARDSKSESNYKDNYDCDLVRPGFVFKHTHLPWALELHLLRTEYEPSVIQSLLQYWRVFAPRCVLTVWTCLFVGWMHHSFSFSLGKF